MKISLNSVETAKAVTESDVREAVQRLENLKTRFEDLVSAVDNVLNRSLKNNDAHLYETSLLNVASIEAAVNSLKGNLR